MKKQILCMLLAVFMMLGCCVQNPTEIMAAKKKNINDINDIYDVGRTVESGKQFYVGDLVTVSIYNSGRVYYHYMASELDASYVSDHPEVVTVQEDGLAQTKAPGTATITVSCGGKSAKVILKVVRNGALSFGKSKQIARWEAAAERFQEKIPDKLTLENGYKFLKALKQYLRAFEDVKGRDGDIAYQAICGLEPGTIDDENDTAVLLVPAASCYNRAVTLMGHYVEQYHPTHQKKYRTGGKYTYYKVSSNADGITLTFKKRLTRKSVLAVYMEEAIYDTTYYEASVPLRINAKIIKDRMEAHTYLSDENEEGVGSGRDFVGVAVFKAGSKNVTIKPTKIYKSVNGKGKFVKKKNLKLEKGKTYRVFLEALYGECSEYITIK